MESGTSELTELVNRLEKLEKQNSKFKKIGAVALILAASALLLMGQAPATRTVEANEFILKDADGRQRAKLSIGIAGPALTLDDENGRMRAWVGATPFGGFVSLSSGNQNARIILSSAKGRASLIVTDEDGFETTIGTTDLVTTATGETHKTSAASVVLFDKDKKVLWKAP